MKRDLARIEAERLAPLIAALNAAPVGVQGGDPLIGPFAKEWIEKGIVSRSTHDGKKMALDPLAKITKLYEGVTRKQRKRDGYSVFLPVELRKILVKKFDAAVSATIVQRLLRNGPVTAGGDLQRSAMRFRKWIDSCVGSRTAAKRAVRNLEKHTRLSVTDRIAFGYLSRIAALGIFRCQYAECGKLFLNTSGHGERKFCTGTSCAQNEKSARLMARKFATVQEEKKRRAKAAISDWPGTGDLKSWIVDHANVSRNWVTLAARRGDIHVPGEKRSTAPRRLLRAPSAPVEYPEKPFTPIRRIQRRPSDDWEDDLQRKEPRWIHDGGDERGLFKTRKRADGGTYREYRYFCKKCGVEVGTLPVCPECQAGQPRRGRAGSDRV